MKESEIEFFKALGLSKQQLDRTPDFMVETGKDKIRLMLRSTLEPGITFGEWVMSNAIFGTKSSEFAFAKTSFSDGTF